MPDPITGVAHVLLDLAFLPACCWIAELSFKQEMADHGFEPLIDVSALAAPNLINSRLHIVVDTSLRNAALILVLASRAGCQQRGQACWGSSYPGSAVQ